MNLSFTQSESESKSEDSIPDRREEKREGVEGHDRVE